MPLSRGSGPLVPGMPSDVQSEVGAEVGRLHVLAESRPAERPVNQEGRRDGVGLADAGDLHERVAVAETAAGAQAIAACRAEAEVAMHQRVHDAVLEPQLMPFIAVPVDLGVDVVAVQALGTGVEVVGSVARLVRVEEPAPASSSWGRSGETGG